MKNIELEIMKNSYLEVIEKCKSPEMTFEHALIKLAVRGISYRVSNAAPNVITYWHDGYNISGAISK
jgi:hypothetical protein